MSVMPILVRMGQTVSINWATINVAAVAPTLAEIVKEVKSLVSIRCYL